VPSSSAYRFGILNAADCHPAINDLCEVHEAEIGQTKVCIVQSGVRQVDRTEPKIGDDAGSESVWRGNQKNASLRGQHLPKDLDMAGVHQIFPSQRGFAGDASA
jgi:hypothetical protein